MKRFIYTLTIFALTFQGCSSHDASNINSSTSGFIYKENGGASGDNKVANGNAISFLNSNNLYVATTGMHTITESVAAKMWGNFTSTIRRQIQIS